MVLNVVLAVVIVALILRKEDSELFGSGKLVREEARPGVGSNATSEGAPEAAADEPTLPRYMDAASGSERRRLIVDRLRVLGAPNEVLGRVARVDFEVQWDSRFEENWGDPIQSAAVQLEMNLSKDAEMRAALGEEDFKQWDQEYMLWEAMSTKVEVTASEADSLYSSKKKLQQRMLELDKARLEGTMDDAEINEAIDQAYAELNQHLRAVLGDERYAKSQQIDEAFMADNFRHQLAKANPTEAQFQQLFKAEMEWNLARMKVEQQFQNNTFSPEYLAKLKALDAAHDEEYQRVLGAAVFDSLRKQRDPAYSQMKKYESHWGLNDEKIDYVYSTMKQYNETVADYQVQVLELQERGQSVDAAAVNRYLQQVANEAQQALENYVGKESLEKLQGNRVLRWATLEPPPGVNSPP
jgi:hypothetical protein